MKTKWGQWQCELKGFGSVDLFWDWSGMNSWKKRGEWICPCVNVAAFISASDSDIQCIWSLCALKGNWIITQSLLAKGTSSFSFHRVAVQLKSLISQKIKLQRGPIVEHRTKQTWPCLEIPPPPTNVKILPVESINPCRWALPCLSLCLHSFKD